MLVARIVYVADHCADHQATYEREHCKVRQIAEPPSERDTSNGRRYGYRKDAETYGRHWSKQAHREHEREEVSSHLLAPKGYAESHPDQGQSQQQASER